MSNWTVNDTQCQPIVRREYAAGAGVTMCQIVLNLVIIGAAIHGRRILRHNYVYAYVTSTLAANVAFGCCCVLTLLSNYLATETGRTDFSIPWHDSSMRWFAFRKSFTVCLFIIMSGNIAALIYGLRESTYFVGKFAMRKKIAKVSIFKKSSIRTRKNRAIVIITLVWFFPCLASLFPPLFGACLRNCRCHPAVYSDNVCQTHIYKDCSATWIPVSKYFLGGVLGVWFILIIFIFILLISTVNRFVMAVSPTTKLTDASDRQAKGEPLTKIRSSCCHCGKMPRFNHSIKLLISITVLYFALTLPAMVIIIIDLLSKAYILNPMFAFLMFVLIIVYAFLSPILMVTFMPGLRSAVLNMCSRIDKGAQPRAISNPTRDYSDTADVPTSYTKNYSTPVEEDVEPGNNNMKVIEIPVT